MAGKTRRDFLRISALGVGSAGTSALIPSSISKAMAIPAYTATGSIMDVQHVVIHMQENRSFDHYLGSLNGVRGFGDPRAIRLPGGSPVWRQPSGEHPDGYVMPFHGDSKVTRAYTVDGSGQSHQDNLTILHNGCYDRWGHTRELHKRMVYYNASDLPFYYALASSFTVCDHFHCSTLTQTYPNRLHLWSGCNGGGKVGGDPNMTNDGTDETPTSDMADDKPFAAYTWTTYAERLQEAGISWKVYQEYDNFNDNLLALFKNFRDVDKSSPLYRNGRSWVSEHDSDQVNRRRSDGDQLVQTFRHDLAAGTLPQVSWIVTAADLSEHPDHVPARGENVTAKLVETLVDHPEMFAKTVFIVIYDEVGGMFDHVPPPTPPIDARDGQSTVSIQGEVKHYGSNGGDNVGPHPIGLGMRVPAIIVSPWSRGGWVCSEVFDHTSTLRFLEARFGVREENISDWRRSVCGDMTSAFDFASPNRDWTTLSLPHTADYLARIARSHEGRTLTIPERQAPAGQPAHPRRARPLPYELHADAREDADGRCVIELVNSGTTGAVFQIYDYSDRQGPWRYTVESGKRCTASTWNDGIALQDYNLAVHGPNGFYRHFQGDVSGPRTGKITIAARYEPAAGAIAFELRNLGGRLETVHIVQADIYPLDPGQVRFRRYSIEPGGSLIDRWTLAASDHWYDLSITAETSGTFLRRYAGHIEDGHASKTDAAIGKMRLQHQV
jgi:phospholipase C